MRLSTCLCAAAALFLAASPALAAPLRAYVGTYTGPSPDNHGQGIYLMEVNEKTGALEKVRLAAKTPSPSWIVLNKAQTILYAGNEDGGTVSAFAVNAASGVLTALNKVDAGGSPAFVSIDASGKYILSANWTGSTLAVVPIKADGSLGTATQIFKSTGPLNRPVPADAPPGQFATSDHTAGHPHMIVSDPSGHFVIANDAGLDKILLFRLDTATGKLNPAGTVNADPGAAPRHLVFSPDGRTLYELFEQSAMLGIYSFDPQSGGLKLQTKVPVLPKGFAGSMLASELLISRDGKYLYAATRLHDAITTLAVGTDGSVRQIAETPTQSDYPRSLAIDPSGDFLYSLNQRGDAVTIFRITNGIPKFTGQYVPFGSPATMVFLK